MRHERFHMIRISYVWIMRARVRERDLERYNRTDPEGI